MNFITVNSIQKKENVITIFFDMSEELSQYFLSKKHIVIYEQNVEKVPDSIAVIPFVANVLPLLFVLNANLVLDVLDYSFFNIIGNYRCAYENMIGHSAHLGGLVVAKKLDNNIIKHIDKTCLLFSGGIDAVTSLITHEDIINECITIWGADVNVNNMKGWNNVHNQITNILSRFGKKSTVLKSNFREYYNEPLLDSLVAKYDSLGWWHGFQHGIGMLGQISPLLFIEGYKTVYIASSYTNDYQPVCASNPLTDKCFTVASSITIHDGVEYDRCDKVKIIENWVNVNSPLNIHVCWKSDLGLNCGKCEKCIRSYLNCRCSNVNGNKLGIIPTLSMKKMKNVFFLQEGVDETIINTFDVLGKALCKNFKKCPKDLKWIKKCYINKKYFFKKRKQLRKLNKIKSFIMIHLSKIYHIIKG